MGDPAQTDSRSRLKRWKWNPRTVTLIGLAAAVSALSLILRAHVPITVAGEPVDDLLFVRGATYLAHGQWLGPFDQFTLVKGPGYPAFIAAMYRSGVSLKVGEQLTYLLASAAIAGCIWVVTRRRAVTLAAYAVLALDPVNFSTYGSRLIRDGWYSSICMLFVATFFLAIYGAVMRTRLRWLVPLAAICGFSGAAFWLGREEGPWILPTLCVIGLGLPSYRLARWWFAKSRTRPGKSRILLAGGRLGLVGVVVVVALLAPIAVVTSENSKHYGVALTNDLELGQFARAYADWRRVQAGTPNVNDPISRAQREAVYQISSAARELEPYLDPSGPCVSHRPCSDHVWLGIRNAAAKLGYFRSASDAQGFFGQLDAQIQAGCESGQLICSPRLPAELQSLQLVSVGPLLSYVGRWAGMSVVSSGFYDLPFVHKETSPVKRSAYPVIVPAVPLSQETADAQVSSFLSNAWPYRLLAWIYRVLLPCLLVLAVTGIVWSLTRRRWPMLALVILSLALLVGFVARLIFVGILNTSQFPTLDSDVRYLLPAHALLLSLGVVGAALFVDGLQTKLVLRREDGRADEGDGLENR